MSPRIEKITRVAKVMEDYSSHKERERGNVLKRGKEKSLPDFKNLLSDAIMTKK